ncbi:nucleotidyltransferase family protein [Fulvivirga lutimaris]|uniref:nucleotidyltransferase family protein n=1 Tax=Fulvivirga lutimaris TaxID=1819566 RepID=UPI0012BC7CDF|nr:nucleotidyltransferase family protein [Fulvivirga lutimaris]MTI38007.1 nucleotidyltransferase family protein [Fulvivirga lutimaris]
MPKGAILILAAGNSSRLGRSKQLVEISKGQTLLNQSIQTAEQSQLGEVYVVLGADYKMHSESINSQVHLIENSNWSAGMGSSLKAGLAQIASSQNQTDFIVVSVCDQPYLETENFLALYSEFKKGDKPIIASKYDVGFGVPVLFSNSVFNELLQLGDGEGALKFLKINLEQVAFVDFKKGNIDIDTQDDLLNHLSN